MIPDKTLYSAISNKYNTFTPEEVALFSLWERKVPDTCKNAFCHGLQNLSVNWFKILHLKVFSLLNSVGEESVILMC